jgi:type I restriction enzyme S subunit
MYTERFTKYSINSSKGSTTPYILFSDLAKYEFDLSPIAEQRKLADLLWAATAIREAYKKLLTATDEIVKSRYYGELLALYLPHFRQMEG